MIKHKPEHFNYEKLLVKKKEKKASRMFEENYLLKRKMLKVSLCQSGNSSVVFPLHLPQVLHKPRVVSCARGSKVETLANCLKEILNARHYFLRGVVRVEAERYFGSRASRDT